MKHSYDIDSDSCGGHKKYLGNCEVKANNQSKIFCNLVIVKQNLHLVCSGRTEPGQISGSCMDNFLP